MLVTTVPPSLAVTRLPQDGGQRATIESGELAPLGSENMGMEAYFRGNQHIPSLSFLSLIERYRWRPHIIVG